MDRRERDRIRNETAAEGNAGDTGSPLQPALANITLGPIERELGETAAIVNADGTGRTPDQPEHTIEERRAMGIEDNTRHVDSIGRR